LRLVVNTNILFSFFNAKSTARRIATLPEFELYSPKFSFSELEKYKSDIINKFNLTETQYSLILSFMKSVINFVELEEYEDEIKRAKEISPDPDDVDFFALALKLNCPLWSNDSKLKEQEVVKVLSTKDLSEIY